jgi:predicted DNA-binding transcriptional regulator
MVRSDQALGWLIFLGCSIVAVLYFIAVVFPGNVVQLLGLDMYSETFRLYLIAIPVLFGFIVILAIGAWIGWTIATTPPPRPIEEIEADEISEEAEQD